MVVLTWVIGLVRRRAGRVFGQAGGIAVAVLLLASLGAFFTSTRSSMTAHAVGAVPVDWQVQIRDPAAVGRATRIVSQTTGVIDAVPVGYARAVGFSSRAGATVQTTGPGMVLGLPAGYAQVFPGEIRPLVGAQAGVLLAQQTAANLGATVGSTVSIKRPGQPPARVTVAGVVDLPAADSLFQTIGAPAGSTPTAPPDNVLLVPIAAWKQLFARAAPGSTSTQIHVQLSRELPADPGVAFAQVQARARNLEATLAGAGQVGDNLAAQLDAARSDAIYAEMLFLFLGLPGAIIAALLVGVIASLGRERRAKEQALLRVRGASPLKLAGLSRGEAVFTGVVGAVVGLATAAVVGRLAFGVSSFGTTTAQEALWVIASFGFALGLAWITIAVPAARDARTMTVRDAGTAELQRDARAPWWQRFWVDALCLTAGGLIYWQAVRSGYQVVLAPEGVPTISVSYFTMLAPLLFWIGSGLLIWRLGFLVLRGGRTMIARATRPVAHQLSGVVAATMSRRWRPLARGVVLMALAASFALSVAIFNTTYMAQSRVDSELTNGADVTATTAAAVGLPAATADAARQLPGVAAAEPMQHRYAYVGNDLQDLYGIDPTTIGDATSMSDAFFAGGSAAAALGSLASTPDGVLVSEETVHDFQLQLGDTIRLRLQFSSDHRYHAVPFTYVGVSREFPTAPHDSFLVANAAYVAQATGSDAVQTLLIRTTSSPQAVADEVRALLGPASGATVTDIASQQRIALSGLTAIDLAGLTKLELAFALVLAMGSSGLVLALGLAERSRTFALAAALGAKRRQLGGFVWSEAGFVCGIGLVLGAISGWWLALVIVRILTGVFDPPPEHLSIPTGYLLALLAATIGAVVVAGLATLTTLQQPVMDRIRDL